MIPSDSDTSVARQIEKGVLRLLYSSAAKIVYLVWLPILKRLDGIEAINRFLFVSHHPEFILRRFGASIGKNSRISPYLTIHGTETNYSNLQVGNNVHIGKGVFLDLSEKILIQDNVTISMGCKILTHTCLGDSGLSDVYPSAMGRISIGRHSYLGANVTVLHSTGKIGEFCLIGANSLVRSPIPDKKLALGTPAKIIRSST